ncbi:TetR/AcrR family transcriptional regulator [Streptomyces sp. V4-01]|uniref:TetR/AcrR family transcriptional regulator n=1 Tax=Actinacidiphila polyblastidii TaxID=3110430 RepID=A0ABU7PGB4_9ACTN|nr:TetR/AcrR family transcriptional regulator [Streptomyces sp. V4-01]
MPSLDVPPGRKRDASRDDDLCRAALELLAEVGFGRLTIDAVAARAGAGKATVYRRWPGKAELVVDALSRMKAAPDRVDTGSLRGDLVEFAGHLDSGDDPFQTSVTAGLVSSLVHDADLRAAFAERFIAPRKRILRTMFERAVARGEIPSRPDFGPLADVLPALAIHRMITTGLAPDSAFALTLIDQVVLPLAHHSVPARDTSTPTSGRTGFPS